MEEFSYHEYPPFPGFSEKGMKFLSQLKKNNRREWLTDERKEVLNNELFFPMRSLLAELGKRSQEKGMQWNPDPKKSIFRIYRDTRFSKDKKPFKTNIGAVLPFADEQKKGIGCYIRLDPEESFFGGGGYFLTGDELKKMRSAIDADPKKLRSIIKSVEKKFGEVKGEQLKRAPTGYDPDHPAIDLLRFKQLWTMRSLSNEEIKSPKLVNELWKQSMQLHDLCSWLHTAVR